MKYSKIDLVYLKAACSACPKPDVSDVLKLRMARDIKPVCIKPFFISPIEFPK